MQTTQDSNRRVRPGVLLLLAGIFAALLICVGLSWKSSTEPSPASPGEAAATDSEPAAVAPAPAAAPAAPVQLGPFEDKWGIQVSSIALARADSVVDVRYTVLAPEKATLLGASNTVAYLMDLVSGTNIPLSAPPRQDLYRSHSQARSRALLMPQAGSFPPPPSRLTPGRGFSVLVPNLGGAVQRGSRVAVAAGGVQTDGFTVE